jgi:hypothetical protein
MRSNPGFFALLFADPLALFALVPAVAVAVFFVALPVAEGYPSLAPYGAAVTVVAALLAFVRVRTLQQLLDGGREAPGEVVAVGRNGRLTQVTYTFTVGPHRYRGTSYRLGVTALQPDDEVTVCVDPNDLSRTLVRELYAV